MMTKTRFFVSCLFALGIACPASAQVAAFKLFGGTEITFAETYTLGFRLEVTEPTLVTKMGWIDAGDWQTTQVAFFSPHATGGTAFATTTVTRANSEFFEGFRYTTLAQPFTLLPGVYRMGGLGRTVMANVQTIHPQLFGVTYQGPAGAHGNNLQYPGGDFGTKGFFGPNFQAVPEPSVMVALGVGAIAVLRRRRKA